MPSRSCIAVLNIQHGYSHLQNNAFGIHVYVVLLTVSSQAESYKVQQKERLRQLELGGLVDYVPGSSSSSRLQGPDQQPAAAAHTAAAAEGEGSKQQSAKPQRKSTGKKTAKAQQTAAAEAAEVDQSAAAEESTAAYATFIVIGSTGNHYVVKLTDTRRSCTCMDHRCDCRV